ncbi:MAG: hypothetical protein Q7V58_10105 [Actinomycetota bacterium]|nr:hypothetical protein [Actinomycetota bacterium]
MTQARVTRWLAWFVGVAFILLGFVEVLARLLSDEPVDPTALAWWFAALCGGGALVLLGSFVITRPGLALAVVMLGCLLGVVATAWTVVLPLLALVLLALRVRHANASSGRAGQQH